MCFWQLVDEVHIIGKKRINGVQTCELGSGNTEGRSYGDGETFIILTGGEIDISINTPAPLLPAKEKCVT